MTTQRAHVQSLIQIGSAVAAVRMREKTGFAVGFCQHIYPSIRSCFASPTGF